MKIIFSHGKESGPWGSKIWRLADDAKERGCTVDSIDYQDLMDPDARVERLLGVLENEKQDFVLVGSSMGGYVSLVSAARTKPKGVFLLAPALYMLGYKVQNYRADCPVEIVHGWSDDVVLPENSIRYAKEAQCPLHLIPGDHRLNSSIEAVAELFSCFLRATSHGYEEKAGQEQRNA